MAENTFKSPGFFEQEIELTAEKEQPTGVPAGIIGAAKMGPAFVPLTLGTFKDFENRFGSLTPEKFAPYAVKEWLKNRQSVTFMRVLGAGSNSTSVDFTKTRQFGIAKNAGFQIASSASAGNDEYSNANLPGATQFLTAMHVVSAFADVGFPMFTDSTTLKSSGTTAPASTMNISQGDADGLTGADASLREISANEAEDDMLHICRAMILNTSGSYFQLKKSNAEWSATHGKINEVDGSNEFDMKIVLSDGQTDDASGWGNDDAATRVGSNNKPNRVYTVSLDPDNTKYIGKVLNTDPKKFQDEGHLLYLDFAIEHELAPAVSSTATRNSSTDYAFLSTGNSSTQSSNSTYTTAYSAEKWIDTLGRFDSRYQAPKTTAFISQPFGSAEYNLFHFECISDGAIANNEFKISISNIKKSSDPNYKFGTFNVEIRKFGDSDQSPQVLERFVEVNLDPSSDQFVARKIGDKKVIFDFDADLEEERRLVISGRYPNKSLNVRIVMNDAIYKNQVPELALPFGFRGIPVLKIDDKLSQTWSNTGTQPQPPHLPPMPMTFKATKGQVKSASISYQGHAGDNERSDARIYWGVKTTRIEDDSVQANAILQSNISSKASKLVNSYTKFMGLPGGEITIGNYVSNADTFNDNKFTLAKVALAYQLGTDLGGATTNYNLVGSPVAEMKSACYIRNGIPDSQNYSVKDNYDAAGYSSRPTLASLVHDKTANNFNKFSKYAKFTNVFYGGWDGLNILDPDIEDLNDRASSTEDLGLSAGGKAGKTANGLGLKGTKDGDSTDMSGIGRGNNIIASYRQAIKIMTEPMTVRHNVLAIPGIRDPYVTDFAARKIRDFSMSMYVMDIPNYNGDAARIFDTGSRPDVEYTANNFESRAIDNNYCATYFPDVFVSDTYNNRRVLVPASIAAIGALSYNDNVSYPWFAPAGFNRGALDFVENVRTRLAVSDRDDLYERRINPIANFPNGGFVIFGQKTMQITQSALDRVNVRRLLLEVKRQVKEVASVVLFEQNTPQTRARFVNLVQPRLALIQAQAGIEKFAVICDDTNNTSADAEENKLNGKIVLIPTRTIEFIAIDFIITNAGVSFE